VSFDNSRGRPTRLMTFGFDLVAEAGLGAAIRTLAPQPWPTETAPPTRPAYQALLEKGVIARCGMTLLAGKAVGPPFVGAVAATFVIAQVLRVLHGAPPLQLACGGKIRVRSTPCSGGAAEGERSTRRSLSATSALYREDPSKLDTPRSTCSLTCRASVEHAVSAATESRDHTTSLLMRRG
jgi:hypothetical protein